MSIRGDRGIPPIVTVRTPEEHAHNDALEARYMEGTYSQRNTGEACWSCAGLMTHAPGERCGYPDSHHADSGRAWSLRAQHL